MHILYFWFKLRVLLSWYLLFLGIFGFIWNLGMSIFTLQTDPAKAPFWRALFLAGIIGFIVSEMAIILGCSTVLGLTVTKLFLAYLYMPYDFCVFLGIFAVTSLLVILLSAITAKIALKKYDLCTLIK